jgi:hypothetical protein
MGELDYGITPNVWRPLLVPDYNTGNDQGSLGATQQTVTETTTTEEIISGDLVGWQKVFDFQAPLLVNSTSFVNLRPINIDFLSPSHLLVITWQDPNVNFGTATIRLNEPGSQVMNPAGPFGAQSTAAVANGIGYWVLRFDTMLNAINNNLTLSIPTPVATAHRSLVILKGYLYAITAATINDNYTGTLIVLNNNTSVANNMPIPHSLLISPTLTVNVQAAMAGGGTSTTITQITQFKLGNANFSVQPTT